MRRSKSSQFQSCGGSSVWDWWYLSWYWTPLMASSTALGWDKLCEIWNLARKFLFPLFFFFFFFFFFSMLLTRKLVVLVALVCSVGLRAGIAQPRHLSFLVARLQELLLVPPGKRSHPPVRHHTHQCGQPRSPEGPSIACFCGRRCFFFFALLTITSPARFSSSIHPFQWRKPPCTALQVGSVGCKPSSCCNEILKPTQCQNQVVNKLLLALSAQSSSIVLASDKKVWLLL